eukprot:3826279-Prymnesium_polylepis.1
MRPYCATCEQQIQREASSSRRGRQLRMAAPYDTFDGLVHRLVARQVARHAKAAAARRVDVGDGLLDRTGTVRDIAARARQHAHRRAPAGKAHRHRKPYAARRPSDDRDAVAQPAERRVGGGAERWMQLGLRKSLVRGCRLLQQGTHVGVCRHSQSRLCPV